MSSSEKTTDDVTIRVAGRCPKLRTQHVEKKQIENQTKGKNILTLLPTSRLSSPNSRFGFISFNLGLMMLAKAM